MAGNVDTSLFPGAGKGAAPTPSLAPSGNVDPSLLAGVSGGGRSAAPKAAAPAKSGGSILGNILGTIGHAAKDVGLGVYDTGRDIARSAPQPLLHLISHPTDPGNLNPTQQFGNYFLNATPSGKGVVAGYKQTGNEVLHPTQIARNYSANPGSAALNDVSNILSLVPVVGPAAKAAGLGKVADAARAGSMGDHVATAMQAADTAKEAVTHPLRTLGEAGLRSSTDQLVEGVKPSTRGAILSNQLARFQAGPAAVKQAILRGAADKGVAAAENGRLAAKALKEAGIKDSAETEAFAAIHEGVAPRLASAARVGGVDGGPMTDEELGAYLSTHANNLSVPGARKAIAAFEGTDPEAAARIDKAMGIFDHGLGNRGARSLATRNRVFMAEHPWQEGFEPNPVAVQGVIEKPTRLANKAQQVAETARSRANADAALLAQAKAEAAPAADLRPNRAYATLPGQLADAKNVVGRQEVAARQGNLLGHLEQRAAGSEARALHAERRHLNLRQNVAREAEKAANDIQSAPSHLRPALAAARDAANHLVGVANDLRGRGLHAAADRVEQEIDSLPTTLERLQATGENPRYVPHVQEGRPSIGVGGRKLKAGSERVRKGSQTYQRTFGAIAKGMTDTDNAAINRAMVKEIIEHPDVNAQYLGKGDLAGAKSTEDAAKLGYFPFRPDTIFGTGPVSASPVDEALGLKSTPFVRKPIIDQFNRYTAPPKGAGLRLLTGIPNRLWVAGRLVATPALEAGRLIGHTVLRSAREDPVTVARDTMRAYKAWKASGDTLRDRAFSDAEGRPIPARVLKAGSMHAELDRLEAERASTPRTGLLAGVGKVNRGLSKVTAAPMQIAHWWDDLNRSAQYITEYERMARNGADVSSEAARQAVAEKATQAALRVTGIFDDLPPAARDYARQAIPFAAWHAAITRIVWDLAVDHPLRVAWTLHLADMAGQQNNDSALPSFEQGSIPVGNSLVQPGILDPFSETGGAFGGGFLGLGSIVGPELKVLLGNEIPKVNPSTGKPWYMPPGTPAGAAPSLLKQAENFFPQTRLVSGLRGKDTVERYANGSAILPKANGYRPVPTGASKTQALLNFLGVNVANKGITEQHDQTSAATKAKTSKSLQTSSRNFRARSQAASKKGLIP